MKLETMESQVAHGTLLWIGDRRCDAWRDAYQYCDAHVSQLAYRVDLTDALTRPSTDVRFILYCRDNDSGADVKRFADLCRRHEQAETSLMLGPLCSGARPSPRDKYGVPVVWWHNWQSILPLELHRCGVSRASVARPASVAVISDTHQSASALLSVASSGGIPSVWIRPGQLASAKGFDEAWWDDSATAAGDWSGRLNDARLLARTHVWITGVLTPQIRQQALQSGVSEVIAKPGDFSRLIQRVSAPAEDRQRRAA